MQLEEFFKHEDRKRGADLLVQVVISSASDTDVRAFVRGSSACKVSLSAEGVASPACSADCTCTAGRKGNLCKHVWAVLLKLEEKGYDFLEAKKEIAKASAETSTVRTAANARAAEFQKERYQKQKDRAKTLRREKKQNTRDVNVSLKYPEPVEEALAFFAGNGFPLKPLEVDELMNAKKLLMRVFHPDKGGTHEETVLLNQNFDIICEYLK